MFRLNPLLMDRNYFKDYYYHVLPTLPSTLPIMTVPVLRLLHLLNVRILTLVCLLKFVDTRRMSSAIKIEDKNKPKNYVSIRLISYQ